MVTRIANRFEVTDRMLGEGGYGAVYEALDHVKQPVARVAAKKMDLCRLRPDQVAREVQAYQHLQCITMHDYVMTLLADAEHAGERVHYLFFPLCDGGDMLDYVLTCGGLSEARAAPMFAQMASALAHLHGARMAHRDVKLENFFLTAKGDVQLGDLGMAAIAPPDAPPGGRLLCSDWAGSEMYMAPEVWQAPPPTCRAYDAYAADVWSLGVCLFTMLTNTMPLDRALPGADRGVADADWRFDLLLQCERAGTSYVVQLLENYGRSCGLSAAACATLSAMLSVAVALRPSADALLGCGWLAPAEARRSVQGTDDECSAVPPESSGSGGAVRPMEIEAGVMGWTAAELDSKRSRSWLEGEAYRSCDAARLYAACEPDGQPFQHAELEDDSHDVMWRSWPATGGGGEIVPLAPRRQHAREGAPTLRVV